MKRKIKFSLFMTVAFFAMVACCSSCDQIDIDRDAVSSTGVKIQVAKITTDLDGKTVEQKNIEERYRRNNLPGSIKHLYIISPLSGQVLIYSTVKGKVTSSSKRLTPSSVIGDDPLSTTKYNYVSIGDKTFITNEVLGDDGTYGSSVEYLYWFDSKGVYHQQYIEGCMIHISDQPLNVKSVTINMN